MPGGAQPRLLEAGWRTEGCVHWPVVSTLHVTSSNQYSLRLDQMLKLYDDVFVGFPLCILGSFLGRPIMLVMMG